MIPSASLGESRPYLFEPIHGSAPDIAGQGIANPLGAVLAGAMLLAYGLGAPEGARQIRRAVESALEAGCRTRDLVEAGHEHVSTAEMTDEIIARL
jgi:3-isopropylmalate dehydrogenase